LFFVGASNELGQGQLLTLLCMSYNVNKQCLLDFFFGGGQQIWGPAAHWPPWLRACGVCVYYTFILQVTAQRTQEWDEMKQYLTTDGCLMLQLRRGLNDVTLTGNDADDACGRCSNCRCHQPVVSDTYNEQLAAQAIQHLKSSLKVTPTL